MRLAFGDVVHDIVKKFGIVVSRPDLLTYCMEKNVRVPAALKLSKAGRGQWDLTPFLDGPVGAAYVAPAADEAITQLSDEDIQKDIDSRFASLDMFTYGVVAGEYRSMIVSGNPGIGKTYTLEYILESAKDAEKIHFESVRGFVRATGLYKLLWENREKGHVLMFDDADSVFADETALNLLKGALDTTKKRTISWRSEKVFEDATGGEIPQSFDFNGAVIFVTNINFQREVARQGKLAPHLDALMSRSFYLDLNLLSTRELLVRIQSVVSNSSILSSMNVTKANQKTILNYLIDNASRLRELSLRSVVKLGNIMRVAKTTEEFTVMANASCIVRGR